MSDNDRATVASGDLAAQLDEKAQEADRRADRMAAGDDPDRKVLYGLIDRRNAFREAAEMARAHVGAQSAERDS